MIGTHSQKKCDILHKIFCEVYHKFVTVKKKLLFFAQGYLPSSMLSSYPSNLPLIWAKIR
jgi:hypothetical protein